MTRFLTIGRVLRPHGVRGALRARFEVDDASWLQPGLELLVGDTPRELSSFGPAPGGPPNYLIRFKGLEGRDQASELKGHEIAVARSLLPELAEDDGFYVEDLVGLSARSVQGEDLGEVLEVYTLAGRLMARVARGLIPLDGPVIESVDFDARQVLFELPAGLFEAQR